MKSFPFPPPLYDILPIDILKCYIFVSMQDFRLPDSLIYTRAGRHLASLGKNRDIEQLLGCIKGLMKHDECDEVVANCIRVMSGNPTLLKEAESLIKLINSDSQKVIMS